MKKRYLLFPLLIFALVAIILGYTVFKPLDNSITIEGLLIATEETDYILVQSSDKYFEIEGSTDFSSLFEFNEWKQQKEEPTGEPMLVLRFAEAWIVEFFPEGIVTAHNGYAAKGKKADAYYLIPSYIVDELITYVEMFGVQHEYGDGAIGSATFHK